MKKAIVTAELDADGNLIVPIPIEIIAGLGWKRDQEVNIEIKDGVIHVERIKP